MAVACHLSFDVDLVHARSQQLLHRRQHTLATRHQVIVSCLYERTAAGSWSLQPSQWPSRPPEVVAQTTCEFLLSLRSSTPRRPGRLSSFPPFQTDHQMARQHKRAASPTPGCPPPPLSLFLSRLVSVPQALVSRVAVLPLTLLSFFSCAQDVQLEADHPCPCAVGRLCPGWHRAVERHLQRYHHGR